MSRAPGLLDQTAATGQASQRILISGGSGFLGRQLVHQALAAGLEVHTLGRSAGPAGSVHHQTDLASASDLSGIIDRIQPEAVIHCAAPGVAYGSAGFAEMLKVAEAGTGLLYAECASLRTLPRIVHLGSGFEYAPGDGPVSEDWPLAPAPESYGAAKARSSLVARWWSAVLPIAVLRPFHIYGAGEAPGRLGPFLIGEAAAGRSAALTGCEQRRDFLHVDDCAAMVWDALARLPREPGLIERNLGSGNAISLADYVATISAQLARRGIIAEYRLGELPYRAGEPMVSLPDIGRWRADQGREARIGLGAGVSDLVDVELARCA